MAAVNQLQPLSEQHSMQERIYQELRRALVQGMFDSGERVEASFVSSKYENRESDVIWKFRRHDGGEPVYVYILLEFQSRPDPSMPVRFMIAKMRAHAISDVVGRPRGGS